MEELENINLKYKNKESNYEIKLSEYLDLKNSLI
jgi:hypothetical protein